jgi:Na+/melibiose symporter-like transporter
MTDQTCSPVPPAGRRKIVPGSPILRRLAMITLVDTFGDGLFLTIGVLYFTRVVGLPAGQVGLGLTIAGGCGVIAGVLCGRIADRWPAKPLMIVLLVIEALGMLAYPMIGSFWIFLALACLVGFVDRGVSAVRSALIARSVAGPERMQGKAFLRTIANVGIGVGSGVAAIALQADTRAAYIALIVVDAATFVVAALLLSGLRVQPHAPTAKTAEVRPPRSPWRDRRYLIFVLLNSAMSLQFSILEIGVPLWVVRATSAPRYLVSVLFILNTVLVVLLQMRASRGMEDPLRASRGFRLAGFLVAASCLAYGYAHGLSPAFAVAALLAAGVAQTLGEVLSSAAGWALSFELADSQAPGAYQGVYGSGTSAVMMIAPVVITESAIRFGMAGWAGLAALFALTGVLLVPVIRRTQPGPPAGRPAAESQLQPSTT